MNMEAVSETNKHMNAISFHPSLLSLKAVKFNDTYIKSIFIDIFDFAYVYICIY